MYQMRGTPYSWVPQAFIFSPNLECVFQFLTSPALLEKCKTCYRDALLSPLSGTLMTP